uniref:Uncharacterized protein n=1 Tax=Strigamia maritima TaxID=126957 RepID=T1IVL8_STRMM
MKFIDLKLGDKTPYDSLLTNSCGPNFVLNRLDLFESMIKTQGIVFWFRFWMQFSFTTCCSDLEIIQKQWPTKRTIANIRIHKEFLKGSAEDAMCYSINGPINLLKFPKKVPHKSKENTRNQLLANLAQESSDIAFGAALCEVFYKWLKAKDMPNKNQNYWIIPEEYLNPDFEPGLLEKFLVERWDNNLVILLGVNLRDIPWLLKIVYGSTLPFELMSNITDTDPMQPAFVEFIKKYRHKKRVNIRNADEPPKYNLCGPDTCAVRIPVRSGYLSSPDTMGWARTQPITSRAKKPVQSEHRTNRIIPCTLNYLLSPDKPIFARTAQDIDDGTNFKKSRSFKKTGICCNDVEYGKSICWYCSSSESSLSTFQNFLAIFNTKTAFSSLGQFWHYWNVANLAIDPEHSPYDTVIKKGCGPNFVLNRIDSFETMGFTFWFRFWLKFCFHPGCKNILEVQDKCANMLYKINVGIHKQFLESTHLIDGCHMMLQKCCEMAFGAALCEVFYRWLTAPEMDDTCQIYWTIPEIYLNTEYQPGPLERYLVDYWEDNLVSLCGVKLRHIPWVLKLIYGSSVSEENFDSEKQNMDDDTSPYVMLITQMTDILKLSRDERTHDIEYVDEKPNLEKIWNIAKTFAKEKANLLHVESVSKFKSKADNSCDEKRREFYHVCSYCSTEINMFNCINFRKCPSCIEQRWKEARYYCSDTCKMEHWFQFHQQEHAKSLEKQQLNE